MRKQQDPSYARGILSVWNDIGPEAEALYERWYMTQHFPERLGVPGFLRGRRYEAIEADRRYFTFYDLTHPDVLFSDAYLARLNAPTAWTETVMGSWRGMLRTVCERVRRRGDAIGGFAAVLRWEGTVTLPLDLADRVIAGLGEPGVVAVDHWRATTRQNESTSEARTRGEPDRTISAALIVETTSAAALDRVASRLGGVIGVTERPDVGTYRLMAVQDAPL